MVLHGASVDQPMFLVWLLFYGYWLFSVLYDAGRGRHKEVLKTPNAMQMRLKGLLLWPAIFLTVIIFDPTNGILGIRLYPMNTAVYYMGITTAIVGILFAIWARRHLSTNWSSQVVLKKGQTLIDTGPYSIVRHPIYLGLTVATIGGAVAAGTSGAFLGAAAALAFSYFRIVEEERLMHDTFGSKYSVYSKRVKEFVPFVL